MAINLINDVSIAIIYSLKRFAQALLVITESSMPTLKGVAYQPLRI